MVPWDFVVWLSRFLLLLFPGDFPISTLAWLLLGLGVLLPLVPWDFYPPSVLCSDFTSLMVPWDSPACVFPWDSPLFSASCVCPCCWLLQVPWDSCVLVLPVYASLLLLLVPRDLSVPSWLPLSPLLVLWGFSPTSPDLVFPRDSCVLALPVSASLLLLLVPRDLSLFSGCHPVRCCCWSLGDSLLSLSPVCLWWLGLGLFCPLPTAVCLGLVRSSC